MSTYLPTWIGCTQRFDAFKNSYITPYIPSKETCLETATQTAKTIASYLPQKGGAATIAALGQEIHHLQTADNRAKVTNETREQLQKQKGDLIEQYSSICGTYFEAPDSPIHLAWLTFIQEETRYNQTANQLFNRERPGDTAANLLVSIAFQNFLNLDEEAHRILEQIKTLGSTIQSDANLLLGISEERKAANEKDSLSKILLPKAKGEYEQSLHRNYNDPSETAALLDIYKELQKQHAENYRIIFLCDQILNAPSVPDLQIDTIVTQKINTLVQNVQSKIALEQSNVGIDWKQTAIYAISGVAVSVTAMLLAPGNLESSPTTVNV